MNGEQLYEFYIKKDGEYAQTLQTAFLYHQEKVFDFMKLCEKEGKTLALIETMEGVYDPPLGMCFAEDITG